MTVLIGHQPLFVGSIEWWARVATADVFVIGDDLDLEPKSPMTRHVVDGQLRNVPVQHVGRALPIRFTPIAQSNELLRKAQRSLPHMWAGKPHRSDARELLAAVFEAKHAFLGALTIDLMTRVHGYLGLGSKLVTASRQPVKTDDRLPSGPTTRIVRQCVALEAGEYWCGVSGAEYLALELFAERRIAVAELEWVDGVGDPGTPVLDAIAAHGPQAVEVIGRCRPSRWLVPEGSWDATSSPSSPPDPTSSPSESPPTST